MIKVVDDVITKDYQDYILHLISEEDFPLYFKPNIVAAKHDTFQNIHGFIHSLYDEGRQKSNYFTALYPMVLNIGERTGVKFNALDRMRFNFVLGNPESKLEYHLPHVDNFLPHYVAIYYVNDCDGDTFIFEQKLDVPTVERDDEIINSNTWTVKERVQPKKGRMVIFDGRYYHASSFTKTQPYRCVINMNLAKLL